jgi:RHS repeat-associated protein
MGNKSGASSQIISVPQGGGAQHSIGEKFKPDLHTGTGNLTVPIALPPGRNNFQPQLNLVYSTGHGNGPFGVGWGLSVPGVTRKTSKGIPLYDDAKDIFILAGAEDLIPVPGGSILTTRYRPRTEGHFARILHHREAGNNYWEVRSKDGLVSLYGTPRTGHESPGWQDPAVIVDPVEAGHVFDWKLTLTTDPFGNRIEYLYEHDATREAGSRLWDQRYLSEVRYADYDDPSGTRFLARVRFIYEERPDPFSEYRAGFEIRTLRRCTRIAISTHAVTDAATRTYHLDYLDQREIPPEQLPRNGVSLISRVRVVGHDGGITEELPPLEFGYTRFNPDRRDFKPITGSDMPSGSLARPEYELADLTGNGLPDILEMNGTTRYWRNLGGGSFDLPREMRFAPAGISLADDGVQLIDADGDGRIDLLVSAEGASGFYPLRFGGFWNQRSFLPYRTAPSFNLKDPEVRLVDLDGDGVTDAIRSGVRFECFFNDPREGWKATRRVERRAIEMFPDVNFSDTRVKWADMTGDGMQDIVLVCDGNIEYWPNMGRGNWGKRVSMRHSPRFPDGFDPRRILIGDVDGDGVADLVYVEDTQVTLWINQCGNGWGDPIEIQGTPPVSDIDAVRLTDLFGVGVGGVLWSAGVVGSSRASMFFLDFTGGVKPYLLNEIDNHMGAVTCIGYAPSTRFFTEDERRPATRWKTPLPFPVQVVARVQVIDRISGGKLTTEYNYHHGYWDGAEREFRGFGRVDQRDTEVFADFHAAGLHPEERAFAQVRSGAFSPPTETRTWFHQGPVGDEFGDWEETDFGDEFWPEDPQVFSRPPAMTAFLNGLPRRAKRDALRTLRGHILRTELYALDGSERQARPYTITEQLWGVLPLPAGDPRTEETEQWRLKIFFPHPLAERTTQWERGSDPMTQFTFTGDYNAYGQSGTKVSIAVPRGRDFRLTIRSEEPEPEPYPATCTRTSYAHRDDDDKYIIDRAAMATNYKILNDGREDVFTLTASIMGGAPHARLEVIGQALDYYDGTAFEGLPLGRIGDYGALVRTETLVFTESILHEAYKSGRAVLTPPEAPPFLTLGGAPPWTDDYPQEFRDLLPALAGYTHHAGDRATGIAAGYFVNTECRRYDFQASAGVGRGLFKVKRDPLGRETAVAYDAYSLMPIEVTDPSGLSIRATYDYRFFQPRAVIDPNGNRTVYAFTPLGLLASVALMGRDGEGVGDTEDSPGTRFEYDFLSVDDPRLRRPVSVSTIRREHHAHDDAIPFTERTESIRTVEYSDGFGRLLQTRTQAEDVVFGDATNGDALLPADPSVPAGEAVGRVRANGIPQRVVVSGWQIFDNKGRVVEKYEPFFSEGWAYAPPGEAERGQRLTMFYDPRGRVIRTINPDGSEQRVIQGVPGRIGAPEVTTPDMFEPTPWETYTYDANDNSGRTHRDASRGYAQHRDTPASMLVDGLGRTVEAVERNGSNPATDWFKTRSTFDARGNLLTMVDALGRVAFRHVYDLADRLLRIESIDAGTRRIVLDAAGNEIERRDSKGSLLLHAQDTASRPIRLWARDSSGESVTLRGRIVYGDAAGLRPGEAEARNLLGKVYEHYDEAGAQRFGSYDFKGNALEKERQVIRDEMILSVFDPAPPGWQVRAFRVDWQPPAGISFNEHARALLETTAYQTSQTFDALNRVKSVRYPLDVEGARKDLRLHYNRAGALERVELGGVTYVGHIAYNARGQRTLIVYGNGVMTRYAYDPQTFLLARLRTEHYLSPARFNYRPVGTALQDITYTNDLAGNITLIRDRTPESGVPGSSEGTDALTRAFTYDPLYRLLSATGRECDFLSPTPWDERPRCADLTRTRAYTQRYQYDSTGNMTRLQHQADGGSFTREFALAPGGNRLATMAVGATLYQYDYDLNGNLLNETTSRHFEWDHSDRMRTYRTQAGGAEPSVYAHYLYDSAGRRVMKIVRRQGSGFEVTVCIDDIFEHRRWSEGGVSKQCNCLHIIDSNQRVAVSRVGDRQAGDAGPRLQYHVGNELGSSNLVIDAEGMWVNREEYTPYGETSFGSFARKRFRFTGNERDEESGLNYHEARYYAPWLVRWTSPDPEGITAGLNVYRYADNRPTTRIDRKGRTPVDLTNATEIHSALNRAGNILGGLPVSQIPETISAANREVGGLRVTLRELEGLYTTYRAAGLDARASEILGRMATVSNQISTLTNRVSQLTEASGIISQITAGASQVRQTLGRLVSSIPSHQFVRDAIERSARGLGINLSPPPVGLVRRIINRVTGRGGSGGGGGTGGGAPPPAPPPLRGGPAPPPSNAASAVRPVGGRVLSALPQVLDVAARGVSVYNTVQSMRTGDTEGTIVNSVQIVAPEFGLLMMVYRPLMEGARELVESWEREIRNPPSSWFPSP